MGHLAGNGARASLVARESLDVAVAALRGAFFKKAPDQASSTQSNQVSKAKD